MKNRKNRQVSPEHLEILNRLLAEPDITAEGAFALGWSTYALFHGHEVSEEQMRALARSRCFGDAVMLALDYWPDIFRELEAK